MVGGDDSGGDGYEDAHVSRRFGDWWNLQDFPVGGFSKFRTEGNDFVQLDDFCTKGNKKDLTVTTVSRFRV